MKILHRLGIIVILLVFCCSASLAEEANNYEDDFDTILSSIETLGKYANYISEINGFMWQTVGPENIANRVEIMAEANISAYVPNAIVNVRPYNTDEMLLLIMKALTTYDQSELYNYMYIYQTAYTALKQEDADDTGSLTLGNVKSKVKSFRDLYEDSHPNAVKALRDYYTKLQSYANCVTSIEGNLTNYAANTRKLKTELEELKANAEFER